MSQEKAETEKRLTELLNSSEIKELDIANKKYMIISDIHLGDGGGADDFRKNEETLTTVLNYYNEHEYELILLGDIEEFWQFDLVQISKRYNDTVYKTIRAFGKDRVHRVFGNHDLEWCGLIDPINNKSSMPACATEAIRMKDSTEKPRILLVHGHQGDTESDKNSWLSRAFVRAYKGIEPALKVDPHTSATKSQIITNYEQIMYTWAKKSNIILICGHSHRAIFASKSYADTLQDDIHDLQAEILTNKNNKDIIKPKIKKLEKLLTKQQDEKLKNRNIDPTEPDGDPLPCYFNTGCAIFTDGITTIEISDDKIKLVKWSRDTTKDPRFDVYGDDTLSKFITRVTN